MKNHQETITNNDHIAFMDFANFKALSNRPEILNNLITCYCDIFSEPEVWAEHYSREEILDKLKKDLSGYAAMRLCVHTVTFEVYGFCWAQLLTANDINDSIKAVHYYQKNASTQSDDALHKLIGKEKIVYIQDLGVKKQYRGLVPLDELIITVLANLAHRTNVRELFFWSVSDTCVSWLAKKVNIDVIYKIKNMQFFSGVISPELMSLPATIK